MPLYFWTILRMLLIPNPCFDLSGLWVIKFLPCFKKGLVRHEFIMVIKVIGLRFKSEFIILWHITLKKIIENMERLFFCQWSQEVSGGVASVPGVCSLFCIHVRSVCFVCILYSGLLIGLFIIACSVLLGWIYFQQKDVIWILYMALCAFNMEKFIDWSERTCDFTGEAFRQVVEFAKQY